MANISTYLQAIMDAVYGEEVRGSIHDAISLINDVGEKVLTVGTDVTSSSSSTEGYFDDSLYLNTSTWDLWKCTGSSWAKQGNIRGIVSIAKTGTSGLDDTYTISYTDGTTSTFTVSNGNGIASIAKTSTSGLVDTYTITYDNGSTSTFTVSNGAVGADGFSPTVSVSKTGKDTTVTITSADGPTEFHILDGADGQGSGDMLTSVYDTDQNGIVDAAESVPWSGVQNKPVMTASTLGIGSPDGASVISNNGILSAKGVSISATVNPDGTEYSSNWLMHNGVVITPDSEQLYKVYIDGEPSLWTWNGTEYVQVAGGGGITDLSVDAVGILPTNHGGTGNADGYIKTGLKSGVWPGTKATAEGLNTSPTGNYSHAEGETTTASKPAAHAEGNTTTASGDASHAEGRGTTASGDYSHAEGWEAQATSGYSHAEGYRTKTMTGTANHAEGNQTTASGDYAHAEGYHTVASAQASHAEGSYIPAASGETQVYTTASGEGSHAEGLSTTASGKGSHAEGGYGTASGVYSHVEGGWATVDGVKLKNVASGDHSHAEGAGTSVSRPWGHVEGLRTICTGDAGHAEGEQTKASHSADHAEGSKTTASGYRSHAEGRETTASGYQSHAEGDHTTASGESSHAEGSYYSDLLVYTTATAFAAHAEGVGSTASGTAAHSGGSTTKALFTNSFAHGNRAKASAFDAVAFGEDTVACANHCVAVGVGTQAGNSPNNTGSSSQDGEISFAEGAGTIAQGLTQHASGHYNVASAGSYSGTSGNAFIIGNGTATNARSNCFRVTFAGAVYGKAAYNSSGADYAEFFEWKDGNEKSEDRIGYFVTLDGDKIEIANAGDYILGVVTGHPSVIGNGDEDWANRWKKDDFGRMLSKKVEVELDGDRKETSIQWIQNPDYDASKEYVERKDRSEWDTIAMLGVIEVRDDDTCEVNGYCSVKDGGIATKSDTGYRVTSRVAKGIIKIIMR